jgi:diguanylate cyclase (GGDEF)-like protein/PAS domain S-box-containing protein
MPDRHAVGMTMHAEPDIYKSILDNLYDGVYLVDRHRRITYWNKGAERLTGYSSDEVLGRACMDNILAHVDGTGRELCRGLCPLAASMHDGAPRQAEVYLRHKEGHRVPVRVRVAPLRDEHGEIQGAVEIFTDEPNTAALNAVPVIQQEVLTCRQTRVPNRDYLQVKLQSHLDEFARCGWPFAVLRMDLDRFQEFNDLYGRNIGDELLLIVARTLAGSLSSRDIFGRWDGDEFVALLAGIPQDRLGAVAERCRALVERSCRISGAKPFSVTLSIGATFARAGDSAESLMERAGRLLRESKQHGRNRVSADDSGAEARPAAS